MPFIGIGNIVGRASSAKVTPPAVMSGSLLTNLLAYWNLNESVGARADATGNGYTMTEQSVTFDGNGNSVFGGATNSIVNNTGLISSCPFFNDQYFLANSSITLNGLSAVSMSFWFKGNTNGRYNLVGAYDGAGNDEMLVYTGGKGPIRFLIGDLYEIVSSTTLDTTSWYHVACTFGSSTGKLYINGNLEGTTTATSSLVGVTPFCIGDSYQNGIVPFNGSIDEVGLWNKTLTASEVTSLYNGGAGKTYG